MEISTVNSILNTNDPMPRNERQKADKSKKTPMKASYIKINVESYKYQIAESSSPSVRWSVNAPLTQKDTWDRGAWIKIQKERHAGGLIWKGQKSKSTKVLKWHGNEEQMNIVVYHMLQSCGAQAGSYPKTQVTMKLIVRPQQSYPDLKILVSILPNWNVIND